MATNLKIEIPTDTERLVAELHDQLDIGMVAYLVNIDDKDLIYKWRVGTAEPTAKQLDKLRLAYEVFFALAGPHKKDIRFAYLQFHGTVESLGEASYARAIHDGMDAESIRKAVANQLASSS